MQMMFLTQYTDTHFCFVSLKRRNQFRCSGLSVTKLMSCWLWFRYMESEPLQSIRDDNLPYFTSLLFETMIQLKQKVRKQNFSNERRISWRCNGIRIVFTVLLFASLTIAEYIFITHLICAGSCCQIESQNLNPCSLLRVIYYGSVNEYSISIH